MDTPTMVTLTVPLAIPLALAIEIEEEAKRLKTSIPELLSNMLIDASMARAPWEDLELGAKEFLEGPSLTAPPAAEGLTFTPNARTLP